MIFFSDYQSLIDQKIKEHHFNGSPTELYDPVNYIISIGGKRVRPALCLIGTSMFQDDLTNAIQPALALEFFHNSLLVHDDIIDKAPLRRGHPTIHEKWGNNSAILSGDTLLVKAYQFFEALESKVFRKVILEFSNMAIKVCEGQQMDVNFEETQEPDFDQYIQMITYKTAILIGSALKIGAFIGRAGEQDATHLYETGKNIGIAFQIQDDLLDVFGDSEKFGKKHAGDIYENKKTILYFKTLEKANEKQKEELLYWYCIKTDNIDKVYAVEYLFKKLCIIEEVKKELKHYRDKSLESLSKVSAPAEKKDILLQFIKDSIIRTQ
ncbi:MAG: polyprenyl synthetase family protein [Flavobacteriales bacterium Tduv]